jgi:hypothetical protein
MIDLSGSHYGCWLCHSCWKGPLAIEFRSGIASVAASEVVLSRVELQGSSDEMAPFSIGKHQMFDERSKMSSHHPPHSALVPWRSQWQRCGSLRNRAVPRRATRRKIVEDLAYPIRDKEKGIEVQVKSPLAGS